MVEVYPGIFLEDAFQELGGVFPSHVVHNLEHSGGITERTPLVKFLTTHQVKVDFVDAVLVFHEVPESETLPMLPEEGRPQLEEES